MKKNKKELTNQKENINILIDEVEKTIYKVGRYYYSFICKGVRFENKSSLTDFYTKEPEGLLLLDSYRDRKEKMKEFINKKL